MSKPTRSVEEVFIRLNAPLPQAQPDRLATIARMRGMQPISADRACVLEIGCGAGSNLLPLADRYPRARFVGIDVSPGKIQAAAQLAAEAALGNVEFHCVGSDLLPTGGGTFDYIVAPDVYSWMDDRTRESLWALCQEHLSPRGIAYINYHVKPGWQLHDMLGAMMRFAARDVSTLPLQIAAARRLLEFVRATLPHADGRYGSLVVTAAETILAQSDPLLIRNYLQGPEHAECFADFAERAARHGLQVLGDAGIGLLPENHLAVGDERRLRDLTDDEARKATVRDAIFNTVHRQTLLCRADVPLDAAYSPARLRGAWLEGRFTSPDEQIDVESTATSKFVTADGSTLATPLPGLKVAIAYLSSIWPRRARPEDLREIVREQLQAAEESFSADDEGRLDVRLLECCLQGLLEVHGEPEPFATPAGDRPRASRLVRLQAARADVVTSRRHVPVRLEAFDRYVLAQLDGGRDASQLVDHLLWAAAAGQIAPVEEGQPVPGERAKAFIEQELTASLARLAEHGLLVE